MFLSKTHAIFVILWTWIMGIIYFSVLAVSWLGWRFGYDLSPWQFFHDGKGNAWYVDFTDGNVSISGTHIEGTFYIQSVGSTEFVSGTEAVYFRNRWYLSGAAYNKNIGNIDLTNVWLDKENGVLVGYARNPSIGNIYFSWWKNLFYTERQQLSESNFSWSVAAYLANTPTLSWKVKSFGWMGGQNMYDSTYDLDMNQNVQTRNEIRNLFKAKGREFIRGMPERKFTAIGNKIVIIGADPILSYKNLPENLENVDSIIIVGSDFVIDQNIFDEPQDTTKGIMVFSNDEGSGGNIYIDWSVKRIHASLYADKHVFWWNGFQGSDAFTGTSHNQLYINGSIISLNTIGGGSTPIPVCPYWINECTQEIAMLYDLNFLRDFRLWDTEGMAFDYRSDLEDYSLIIDYDPRIILTPPPWF